MSCSAIGRRRAGHNGNRGQPPPRQSIYARVLRGRDPEAGNAPVEFIGWTVLLVVPVVYLLVALAQVQAASFAVASAADAASRILEVEPGDAAVAHARTAVELALSDQGVDADPATAMTVVCADAACSAAVVRVQAGVDLPLLGTAGLGRNVVVMDAARSVTLAGTEGQP
ncbi:peptidase T4 [Actinomyces sp. 594]|uniref:peptidase T4 n=1 Tax=Actinomyces sp. 594 TaxID=2057793 RepID=UPI00280BB9EA|nr:peptidase T4 [Actinomyces sp. 594]